MLFEVQEHLFLGLGWLTKQKVEDAVLKREVRPEIKYRLRYLLCVAYGYTNFVAAGHLGLFVDYRSPWGHRLDLDYIFWVRQLQNVLYIVVVLVSGPLLQCKII